MGLEGGKLTAPAQFESNFTSLGAEAVAVLTALIAALATVAIGSPVGGATPTVVLFVDSSGDLAEDTDLTYDPGTGILSNQGTTLANILKAVTNIQFGTNGVLLESGGNGVLSATNNWFIGAIDGNAAIRFQNNNGNRDLGRFATPGGASETGLMVLNDGTVKRVEVGAADSGGSGYKLLRVVN